MKWGFGFTVHKS